MECKTSGKTPCTAKCPGACYLTGYKKNYFLTIPHKLHLFRYMKSGQETKKSLLCDKDWRINQ